MGVPTLGNAGQALNQNLPFTSNFLRGKEYGGACVRLAGIEPFDVRMSGLKGFAGLASDWFQHVSKKG